MDNTAARIRELSPEAADYAKQLINLARAVDWPLIISESYRPQSRQDYLYSQGRTRPGAVVTWTRNSRHTSRIAFDVDMLGYPPASVPVAYWRALGEVWERAGLHWGGGYADYRHFEARRR